MFGRVSHKQPISCYKIAKLADQLLNCFTEFISFLIAAPAPSNVQSVLATKCLDHTQNKTKFFYVRPNGGCDKIDDLHGPDAEERHLTDKNVVFAFQVLNHFSYLTN